MNIVSDILEKPVTTAFRRLALDDKPTGLGLSCDNSGLTLAGAPLLAKTAAGLQPRSEREIDLLLKAAYGRESDTARVMRGLGIVADSLNAGDVERAMIAAVHLRLPPLDQDSAARLAKVDDLIAKYSPDQPRDWHGRWTADGDGSGSTEPGAANAGAASIASGRPTAPKPAERQDVDHAETGFEPTAGTGIGANAMRIEPHVFQASPSSPDDVPTIVKGFIQSGAALSIRQLTDQRLSRT